MLKIIYGETEGVARGPVWFKYSYDPEWFKDGFVQSMIEDVDGTSYIAGLVFDSPVLGPIPPEKLSGGVQTLVMIYEMPEKLFDATSCGPNCAKWLVEIGRKKDVTVNLRYFMPFDGLEPFEMEIINSGIIVNNADDAAIAALDCL